MSRLTPFRQIPWGQGFRLAAQLPLGVFEPKVVARQRQLPSRARKQAVMRLPIFILKVGQALPRVRVALAKRSVRIPGLP
jgi:hypothetical protein